MARKEDRELGYIKDEDKEAQENAVFCFAFLLLLFRCVSMSVIIYEGICYSSCVIDFNAKIYYFYIKTGTIFLSIIIIK